MLLVCKRTLVRIFPRSEYFQSTRVIAIVLFFVVVNPFALQGKYKLLNSFFCKSAFDKEQHPIHQAHHFQGFLLCLCSLTVCGFDQACSLFQVLLIE
ncbi:hypothetical protein SUGI_0494010 [Cryptomeria japonica]|nr:hypothetical protein SUGI_0494010 [Cryptomeria japonica]